MLPTSTVAAPSATPAAPAQLAASASGRVRRHLPLLLLAALFAAVNGAMLARYGVRLGGDTHRFLSGAAHLLAGEPLQGREPTFVGYAAVVALSQAAGAGLAGVVAVQLLFAALATAALYDTGRRLGGRAAGFLAAAFFGGNPDFARFNVVIISDSLYVSLVALAAWAVHRAAERGGAAYAAAVPVVAFAALVRPNGWVLVPLAAAYWIARTRRAAGVRVALVCAVFAVAAAPLVLLAPATKSVQDVGAYQELRDGTVIWGYDARRLPMPPEGGPASGGLEGMAGYALRHPIATARLAAERLGTEMVHTRPFYSPAHNAVVLAVLLPLYALAVLGLARVSREPLALLLLAIIVAHGAVIAATFADWDGRFLLYVLHLVGVLAAVEAARLAEHLMRYVPFSRGTAADRRVDGLGAAPAGRPSPGLSP
ncbi:MAG: glycosyltransferase family 39 protein [Gemmatimonadetes bacterium]|nr:glycosyltransferase family 39 protein [Gemmatimonadota bacterium]